MNPPKSPASRAVEVVLFVALLASLVAFARYRWIETSKQDEPQRTVIILQR